jgi:glycerate 2-kinase
VLAAGKAAQPMADAFLDRFSDRTHDVVIARGGHPVPDAASFESGMRALRLADENRHRGDLLVVLLSGGASAMMAAPANGVTPAQKIATTRELLRSGRPIAEINAVRKALSSIKGGKLALRAGRSVTFAISDVHAPVEDDPAVIGSGPTVLADAGANLHVDARFVLIGSRRDAMAGAAAAGQGLGYDVHVIQPPILGDARTAAREFVARARDLIGAAPRPALVIASGETTVKLAERDHGRGGRSQEFALEAALALEGAAGCALLAAGTDGIDGPTDAAGAIVDATTIARAKEKSLDVQRALEAHDSYPLFAAVGDHIITGPTGTNVGDIALFARRA